MGRDFRLGLILGLALAVTALIWVATRPSLSPEARMRRSAEAGSAMPSTPNDAIPWARIASTAQSLPSPPESLEPAASKSEVAPADQPPAKPVELEAPPVNPALPDLTIYERDEPITTTRFHIVRRGESLSGIARQYYGSPNEWRKILQANEESVADANRIKPGTKLIIPR